MEETKNKTGQGADRRGGRTGGPRRGGPGRRPERVKPEFDHKVVSVRRVTRVMGGGRRFSFSVTLVAGDRKGRVGVGIGKAGDTSLAITKALNNAKKNMITLTLTKTMSIPHETEAKYGASVVTLKPAPGRGLVAGSSVRNVLDLAGVKDTGSKILSRSKNKLNNSRAAIEALKKLKQLKK
jgi:small subunit ribosomal protein S5